MRNALQTMRLGRPTCSCRLYVAYIGPSATSLAMMILGLAPGIRLAQPDSWDKSWKPRAEYSCRAGVLSCMEVRLVARQATSLPPSLASFLPQRRGGTEPGTWRSRHIGAHEV